jgi:flavin reductase (DIM6/NTAB) family NADH-FMN oxidoreductase RutF
MGNPTDVTEAVPGSDEMPAVGGLFREAMGRLAAGVVMVTCWVDDRPWGLTVTACCSVSVDPPLLLVSLGERTVSSSTIGETGSFGVSLLGERSVGAARAASTPGRPKFVHEFCLAPETLSDRSQTPVVAHALAHVDCSVERAVPAGDHVLYLGRAERVVLPADDRPLVYHLRSYHGLGATDPTGATGLVDSVDHLSYDYPMPLRFSLPPPEAPEAEGELGGGSSREQLRD